VVADALDPEQVADAVAQAQPDVIIHQLTAIGTLDLRHFDRDFALTNRLRTEGTDHLLSAGRAVGIERFIAQSYTMADSLSLAMLVLLETLSPEQRAVLLLRDVFDYGYDEIARIVGKNEDNVRQLASRARAHVEQGRPRFQTSREQREELAHRFFEISGGQIAGVNSVVNPDKLGHLGAVGDIAALLEAARRAGIDPEMA
jgi:hypothetical protein